MLTRCAWAATSNPLYLAYHDEEWGVPLHDDRHLFEMLILEGMQAGLSWSTILNKRANFRQAFADFEEALGIADTQWIADACTRSFGLANESLRGFTRRSGHRKLVAVGTHRSRLTREEARQIRLQVGHGGERRATRFHRRPPVHCDGRGHRLEVVDGRTGKALQELACVRAEALHETPLPLGVERVHGERRLASTTRARQSDELTGRQSQVDRPKVVRARTA